MLAIRLEGRWNIEKRIRHLIDLLGDSLHELSMKYTSVENISPGNLGLPWMSSQHDPLIWFETYKLKLLAKIIQIAQQGCRRFFVLARRSQAA